MLDTQKLTTEDPIVEIEVRSKNIMFSKWAEITWTREIKMKAASIKVEDFVEFILDNGRHRYTYDANGSGCLFWTKTLIQDFANAGWIDASEPAFLKDFASMLRAEFEGPNGYWFSNDKGKFI